MEKNGIYEGEVIAYGTDGEGIIDIEGTTAFVPFCLVGERVRFKAVKVSGRVAYGKVEEIISRSPERVQPPCPAFGKCGGCGLQHMSYAEQLAFKRETVANALRKIGGVTSPVGETVPCARIFNYRNKLVLPIGVDGDGRTVAGFYAPRSHRIVPIEACYIQSEWAKNIIAATLGFCNKRGVGGYDENTKKGVVRHIVVRELKGKFIIALVAAKLIDVKELVSELGKYFEEFTFLLNVNTGEGNAIFGKEWHICRGEGFFTAEEGGILYRAGANTFVQVNDDVREKLYAAALGEAEEGCAAIDLYSGGGLLTAMLAKRCGEAYGIEIVPEASRCADELKELNGLGGRMFNICGKVEERIGEALERTAGKRRVIVCDPPRKGMERSVVRAIAQSGADKAVLISCNPATLARDLGLLTGTLIECGGELKKCENPSSPYAVDYIVPFDMFPQTKHVETLVVLRKKA